MERWDVLIKTAVATGGAVASYAFGGWSALLSVLLAFVIVDYVSGVGAAWFEGKLNSNIGAKGIAKKVAVFFVIAIAHLVDTALGDAHIFRDAAIFFYLANELLSITENFGRMGVPLPPKLVKAVDILKGKGEEK